MSQQQIWDCANEMSHSWLMGAIGNGSRVQIENQLSILEDACAQTLGRMAANGVNQGSQDLNEILASFVNKISHTAQHMIKAIDNGETDLHTFPLEH